MIRRVLCSVAVLPLACGSLFSEERPRLEDVLSSDAGILVMIEDMPRFQASWPDTPLGQAWEDPTIKRFLAPMRETMEIERWEEMTREATGYELEEILESFRGQVALVVHDVEGFLADDAAGPIDAAVIADIGDNDEMFANLLAKDLELTREESEDTQIVEIEEEFKGETLHVRQGVSEEGTEEREGWAVVDGFLIFGEPTSLLRDTVTRIKEGAASPLSETPAFRKIRKRSPEWDTLIYINFGAFLPMIESGFIGEVAVAPTEGEEAPAPPSPVDFDSEAMFNAMALDRIEAAYLATHVGEGSTDIDFGVAFEENTGLMKVLAYGPGPVRLPEFVPENAIEASVSNFSIARAWQALVEMFEAGDPDFAAMFKTQLQQITEMTGVDIEKSVMSSLGDDVITVTFARPPKNPGDPPSLEFVDELFGIAVADHQTLEMALGQLRTLMAGLMVAFDEQEYLGTPIWSITTPGGTTEDEQTFAYTLTDSHLFFSTGSLSGLRSVLALMENPGRSLWKRTEVKNALKSFQFRNASALSYTHFPSLVMEVMGGLIMTQQLTVEVPGEGEEEAEDGRMVDPEAMPSIGVLEKYFGIAVGSASKDDGGFYSTLRVLHAKR